MIGYAVFCGWRLRKDKWDALFVLATSLSLGVSLGPNFGNGNYTYMMTILFPLLAWALFKKYDILAGVIWALLMVKPQEAALLAVPILLARRWKTCLVAAGFCLAAGAVSATLIHKNLIALIFQMPAQGSPFYQGSVLLPQSLIQYFEGLGIGKGALLNANMLVGLSLCAILSYAVRRSSDWRIRLMPAIVFASAWTYMLWGDRALFYIVQIVFAETILLSSSIRLKGICWFGIASVFFCNFATMATCADLFGAIGSALSLPDLYDWVRSISMSIQSAADICALIACAAFCFSPRDILFRC